MRTTLTIDDQLMAELKELAHRQNVPFKQVVNQAIRRGLDTGAGEPPEKPFQMKTFSLGQPLVPSLDKSLAIAATLEDEEIARKLTLRK